MFKAYSFWVFYDLCNCYIILFPSWRCIECVNTVDCTYNFWLLGGTNRWLPVVTVAWITTIAMMLTISREMLFRFSVGSDTVGLTPSVTQITWLASRRWFSIIRTDDKPSKISRNSEQCYVSHRYSSSHLQFSLSKAFESIWRPSPSFRLHVLA